MMSTSTMPGTLVSSNVPSVEQRRRHQLEDRVLRSGHRRPCPTAGRCRGPRYGVVRFADGSRQAHQYAPAVEPAGTILTRRWPDPPGREAAVRATRRPRARGPSRPCRHRSEHDSCRPTARSRSYRAPSTDPAARARRDDPYTLTIPWFGWLFRAPVGRVLGRRITTAAGGPRPTASIRRRSWCSDSSRPHR